eukprot:12923819-Prorocentrum_lima.AAC.1
MMVVPWKEHALMNTQGIHQTDAASAEAINMLPRIAQDPSSIPQELHLRVNSSTSGNPIPEKGNPTPDLGLKPQ